MKHLKLFESFDKITIGADEKVTLPDLGITIDAKVDSGADTSSLHAEDIELDGDVVKFVTQGKSCEAPLVDKRGVKSTSGDVEERYVVRTNIKLKDQTWEIELNLTDRDDMKYEMLIGREAIKGRAVIDVET